MQSTTKRKPSHVVRSITPRTWVVSAIEGILFACALVLGRQLDGQGFLEFSVKTWLVLAALALVSTAVCVALNTALAHLADKSAGADSPAAKKKLGKAWLFACLGVLAVAWLFWYLVFFPGIYAYDAPYWYLEWDDPSITVSSQWSIPYAWLFHAFVRFGQDALGSLDAGFALFIGLQALVVYYAAARIIGYCWQRLGSRVWLVCATAFLACSLPLAIVVFSSAQDTLFMAFFALVFVHFLELSDDPSAYWKGWKRALLLVIAVLLMCFSRNNGFYMMLVCLPFIALYKKGYRRKLVIALAIPLALFAVYQWPVLNAAGVVKSPAVTEMSSIPLQQMARVYCLDADALSEEETKLLESYVKPDALKTYRDFPSVSDQMKGGLDADAVMADPMRFLGLYVSMGAKAPRLYLEGALLQNLGLWYMGKSYPDTRMWHPYVSSEVLNAVEYDSRYITIDDLSVIPQVDAVVQRLFAWGAERFDDIPVIGLLGRSAPYFWLLLFAAGFQIVMRRPSAFLPLVPALALVLTIVLGPVVLFRYMAPIVLTAPLIAATLVGAGWCASCGEQANGKRKPAHARE